MSITYLLVEGTTDSTVIKKVLEVAYHWTVAESNEGFPPILNKIIGSYKYPYKGDISRQSVPAPWFLRRSTGSQEDFTIIANGEGLDKLKLVVEPFGALCFQEAWRPDAVALIRDSDKGDPPKLAKQSSELNALLAPIGIAFPTRPEIVYEDAKKFGLFCFPGNGLPGALENVLVPLGESLFPNLCAAAKGYVEGRAQYQIRNKSALKDLKKPQGSNKATLSAMAALLKPGKPLNASLDDQWFKSNLRAVPAFEPLLRFLDELYAQPE